MGNPVPHPALRAELARAGVEQKQVAAWLGVVPATVTKRMRGDVEWRLSELRIIADNLGVPVSRLVDDREAVSR